MDGFERTVLPIVLHASGCQVLHASAVLFPAGVVGFCGYGGAGKSTTAHALSKRGLQLIADDALAFSNDTDATEVVPLPFRARLRATDAAWLEKRRASVRLELAPHGAKLVLVFVLCRDARLRSGPRFTRLSKADAFRAIVPHAFRMTSRGDVDSKRAMMASYLDLVDRVPIVSLRFRADLDHLPTQLDLIQEQVEALSTRTK